jgi:hypothetical protein
MNPAACKRCGRLRVVRPCAHNGLIAAFYRPFTSVVQKIALTWYRRLGA